MNVDEYVEIAFKSMLATESTYLFSISSLNQLSQDLSTPDFVPTDAQQAILQQALRHLDLELTLQADEHPELVKQLNHCLHGLL